MQPKCVTIQMTSPEPYFLVGSLMFCEVYNFAVTVANPSSLYQPGASNQDREINADARQDPEEHTGGGLNLIFVIIPVVAVVVITAIIVLAVLLCRR